MADIFSAVALGDAVFEVLKLPMKCQSAITKGQLVVGDTHTSGELVSVSAAGANATDVVGVALKSGDAGEIIPILAIGVVKVKNSASAIAAGSKFASDANGTIQALPATPAAGDEQKICGIALQDFAAAGGDEGLVLINCV